MIEMDKANFLFFGLGKVLEKFHTLNNERMRNLRTRYCSGVSIARHSASVRVTSNAPSDAWAREGRAAEARREIEKSRRFMGVWSVAGR